MNSTLCRRDFVTRGLVLAGAALLLPAHRLVAAVTAPAATGGRARPNDDDHRAVLALVARYGKVLDVSVGKQTTRISVRVHGFDTMLGALSGAKEHGISRIRASGNITSFDFGGRCFELENLHHAA